MLDRIRYGCWLLCLILLAIPCLATFALVEPHVWGPRIGSWYTAPQSTPKSDAIVVLGGNTARRIKTGITLYQSDIAPRILITGHNPDDPEDWEMQWIRNTLATEKVPEDDISWVKTSSTLGDAQQIAEQAQIANWKQIVIVSDWYHGRRAVCAIKYVMPGDNVRVTFVPATSEVDLTNWWRSEDGFSGLFIEGIKLFYYNVRYHIPLGGCWGEGMNPIQVLEISSLGIPLSFLLVAGIRWYALRRKKLDVPNNRSLHSIPTPRGGGIAIVGATLALLLLGSLKGTDIDFTKVLAFLITGIIIAGIGLTDDWRQTLSAKARLGLYSAIVLSFMVTSGVITDLYIPILGTLGLGLLLGGVATFVWLVSLINVYNFMDGSDGLAGTQAFLGGSTWTLVFLLEGQETLALLSSLIAASSLGFLALNAPPAKIFMGDVGSTFLGFSFGALPVIAFVEIKNPRLLLTAVLVVGVFVFDATFTILRRVRNGENLLEAHCSHLYQRLIKLGYTHSAVCARYAFLMALSSIGGLLYYFSESEVILLGALIGILALYLSLAGWVTWLESVLVLPH